MRVGALVAFDRSATKKTGKKTAHTEKTGIKKNDGANGNGTYDGGAHGDAQC